MADLTAVPAGLTVRYGRDEYDSRRELTIRVEMLVSTRAPLTDADDVESADWRLAKAIRQTQAAVRAIVAEWDKAEVALHEVTVSPRSDHFLAQATCTCGWTQSGRSSMDLALFGQEHLLENGIVR